MIGPNWTQVGMIAFFSWSLAIAVFVVWKQRTKPWLLYTHLGLLFIPVIVAGLSANCEMQFFSSLLSACTTMIMKVFSYAVPSAVIGSLVIGYFFMPYWIRVAYKATKTNLLPKGTNANISAYLLDTAEPLAFSTRNTIFISVGMMDLLTLHERKAVVLHELSHIEQRSSWIKFTTRLAQWTSPLAWFASPLNTRDEIIADAYAAQMQGTSRFVRSARRKLARVAQ